MSEQISDREKALAFVKKHPMGVLSTSSNAAKPWGAAVYFVADDDLTMYFVVRSETLKYKNLKENPYASLTVADSDLQITLQVFGMVDRVPSSKIINIVFDRLGAIKPKYDSNWMPPIIKVHEGNWMVLRLQPTYAQFADFKSHKTYPDDTYISEINLKG